MAWLRVGCSRVVGDEREVSSAFVTCIGVIGVISRRADALTIPLVAVQHVLCSAPGVVQLVAHLPRWQVFEGSSPRWERRCPCCPCLLPRSLLIVLPTPLSSMHAPLVLCFIQVITPTLSMRALAHQEHMSWKRRAPFPLCRVRSCRFR